jgi:tetratricopeptide (TPR) repeat protein
MPKALSCVVVAAVLLALSCSKENQPVQQPADAASHPGLTALRDRDYDLAITCFTESIERDPSDAVAYNNRGFAYGKKGDYEAAIADFTEAIRLRPTFALAYYDRAAAYDNLGEYERAIEDYTEAIGLKPQMADAYNNRGAVYLVQGAYDQAIEDFDEAIRLDPDHAKAFVNRGAAHAAEDRYQPAIDDYQEAIRLSPNQAGAFNGLAWLLATCPEEERRDGPQAVEHATRACELTEWTSPEALSTLAAAHAESGAFDEAVKWQTKALEAAPPDSDGTEAQSRLELYQAGKPYRDE